jgi:gamma-glutamyltranspeptidase/glutathione hydrolase
MYEFLRGFFVSQRAKTEQYEWSKNTYYPGGHVPEKGELFRQPNLARTLRIISDTDRDTFATTKDRVKAIQAGRDAFYKGDIARRMGAALQKEGSLMRYEDLASYQGFIENPETTNFYGYDIYKCSYWNQGPTLLMALNILEAANVRAMKPGSELYMHTLIEAIKLAYDDRNAYFGDPRFVKVPGEGLLSKAYAKSRAAMIAPTAEMNLRVGDPYAFQAAKRPPGPVFVPHVLKGAPGKANDTTSIQIADKDGNLFSCTPSSGWLSGGAYIAGDTGVPMSNRLTVFDLDPASPNVIVGGKRPRTTLTPSIIMKDGKPFMAIGTPGGDNQDQTLLQAIIDILAFEMPLQAALEAPRATSLAFNDSFFLKARTPGLMEIEDRFDPAMRAALQARGHKLKVIGPYESSSGVVAAGVDQVHNTLRGGADVRRERYAMGW